MPLQRYQDDKRQDESSNGNFKYQQIRTDVQIGKYHADNGIISEEGKSISSRYVAKILDESIESRSNFSRKNEPIDWIDKKITMRKNIMSDNPLKEYHNDSVGKDERTKVKKKGSFLLNNFQKRLINSQKNNYMTTIESEQKNVVKESKEKNKFWVVKESKKKNKLIGLSGSIKKQKFLGLHIPESNSPNTPKNIATIEKEVKDSSNTPISSMKNRSFDSKPLEQKESHNNSEGNIGSATNTKLILLQTFQKKKRLTQKGNYVKSFLSEPENVEEQNFSSLHITESNSANTQKKIITLGKEVKDSSNTVDSSMKNTSFEPKPLEQKESRNASVGKNGLSTNTEISLLQTFQKNMHLTQKSNYVRNFLSESENAQKQNFSYWHIPKSESQNTHKIIVPLGIEVKGSSNTANYSMKNKSFEPKPLEQKESRNDSVGKVGSSTNTEQSLLQTFQQNMRLTQKGNYVRNFCQAEPKNVIEKSKKGTALKSSSIKKQNFAYFRKIHSIPKSGPPNTQGRIEKLGTEEKGLGFSMKNSSPRETNTKETISSLNISKDVAENEKVPHISKSEPPNTQQQIEKLGAEEKDLREIQGSTMKNTSPRETNTIESISSLNMSKDMADYRKIPSIPKSESRIEKIGNEENDLSELRCSLMENTPPHETSLKDSISSFEIPKDTAIPSIPKTEPPNTQQRIEKLGTEEKDIKEILGPSMKNTSPHETNSKERISSFKMSKGLDKKKSVGFEEDELSVSFGYSYLKKKKLQRRNKHNHLLSDNSDEHNSLKYKELQRRNKHVHNLDEQSLMDQSEKEGSMTTDSDFTSIMDMIPYSTRVLPGKIHEQSSKKEDYQRTFCCC